MNPTWSFVTPGDQDKVCCIFCEHSMSSNAARVAMRVVGKRLGKTKETRVAACTSGKDVAAWLIRKKKKKNHFKINLILRPHRSLIPYDVMYSRISIVWGGVY